MFNEINEMISLNVEKNEFELFKIVFDFILSKFDSNGGFFVTFEEKIITIYGKFSWLKRPEMTCLKLIFRKKFTIAFYNMI